MQLRVRHIARNVMSNWLATAANMAVGFFLSPYIVHHLGNVAYGVWVLAISTVNYLTLLDLGMRSSVLRFISKGHTKGDHQGASEAISAALWVRLQISVVVLVLSWVLAAIFPILFKIPPEMAGDARQAVVIIGITTAIGMSIGVFGGVLSGLNRYDLQGYATFVQLVIRTAGVILVLKTGHGIVAIAWCELLAAVVSNLMLLQISRKIYPELRITLARPGRDILRQLWSYSFYVFLVTIAVQLVYQTDNLVVGAFVSASAVTFYSIGNSLCRYTDQVVGSMTLTFVPAASTFEAAGDTQRLVGLYRNGTRAVMTIALPILVTLLTRGRTFIGLWMGPQYEQVSGTVLIILATALTFSNANYTAGSIAYGIEKHKVMAKWAITEGIANLTLSMILAHWFGIYGVAIGTLIPSLFVHLIIWPFFLIPYLGIGNARSVWGVWAPMFLAALPFAALSYAVNRAFPPSNMFVFFLQTVVLLPVFLFAVAFMFRGYVRSEIFPRVRSFFFANAG